MVLISLFILFIFKIVYIYYVNWLVCFLIFRSHNLRWFVLVYYFFNFISVRSLGILWWCLFITYCFLFFYHISFAHLWCRRYWTVRTNNTALWCLHILKRRPIFLTFRSDTGLGTIVLVIFFFNLLKSWLTSLEHWIIFCCTNIFRFSMQL